MKLFLIILFALAFLFVIYLFTKGYPEKGWCKRLIHDKLGIHEPDFNNYLEYDEDSKIVKTKCKYCDENIHYFNVCKYIVMNDIKNIPTVSIDDYCYECQRKNYTNGHNCCPLKCHEIDVCKYCEKNRINKEC